jgi:hypothetical protein
MGVPYRSSSNAMATASNPDSYPRYLLSGRRTTAEEIQPMRTNSRKVATTVGIIAVLLGMAPIAVTAAGAAHPTNGSTSTTKPSVGDYAWITTPLRIEPHGFGGSVVTVSIRPNGDANCVGKVTNESYHLDLDSTVTKDVGMDVSRNGSCTREASHQRWTVTIDQRFGTSTFNIAFGQSNVGTSYLSSCVGSKYETRNREPAYYLDVPIIKDGKEDSFDRTVCKSDPNTGGLNVYAERKPR